jgi:ABC-2 type transport system permease protein
MLLALIAGTVAIVAVDTVDVPAAVPAALVSTVLWFALGYAFWSVAFAAVGVLVSRVEDLQAAVSPLTWAMLLFASSRRSRASSPTRGTSCSPPSRPPRRS